MDSARIMIVEDNATIAEDCRDCLESLGYGVTSIVAFGEEAIEKAKMERPDAVLMDIHLRGEMDGIKAAEQIHTQYQIPVLFLSAYSNRELIDRAKRVGSFGYLVKPFEERELYTMLEMTLYKAGVDKERSQMEALGQVGEIEAIGKMAGSVADQLINQSMVLMRNLEQAKDDLPREPDIAENLDQAFKAAHKANRVKLGSRNRILDNNRRKAILKAAQEVFSLKGLADASISEIAKKAGVLNSVIYQYFKNKEDLLFYSLADKLKYVQQELALHMEGIIAPASRLGKMIWFHLYINELIPTESRIIKDLLLECRGNKNFYTHEGYYELRSYFRIMSNILQQGIDEKVFRSDLNVILARNLIFGMLNEESLNSYVSPEIENSVTDFREIMDLVMGIIAKEEILIESSTNEDKKAKILKAAVKVFADKGYNASTMSEIAHEANTAEGTIYNYFDNKSDLLFSIPQARFQWLRNNMEEIIDIKNPVTKLRRFISLWFATFMGDRDFVKVFLLDIKSNKKFYVSQAYRDYFNFVSMLETILEEGQTQGIFKPNINRRLFRNLFLGGFTHLANRWAILKNAKHIDMIGDIEELVSLLCRLVVTEKASLHEIEHQIG